MLATVAGVVCSPAVRSPPSTLWPSTAASGRSSCMRHPAQRLCTWTWNSNRWSFVLGAVGGLDFAGGSQMQICSGSAALAISVVCTPLPRVLLSRGPL
ncbi:hypothetical protein B0H12DRAFT_131775 [Mycena haematopus]|nr:hypothetical protein B0H12DRAFT_131775 [Mycena haematopus]